MAFTDDFTGTAAQKLDARSGWSIVGGTEAHGIYEIGASGADLANTRNGPFGSDITAYICTDQGSADHYTQARRIYFGADQKGSYLAVRLVDKNNFIGHRIYGTVSAGRRLTKVVGGPATDLITSQGVANEWIKVEAQGNTLRLYEGGTGASPSWTQVGSDQTVTDFNTETSQGLIAMLPTSAVDPVWDDFEAGALGGSTITTRSLSSNLLLTDGSDSYRQLLKLLSNSLALADTLSIIKITVVIERLLVDALNVEDVLAVYRNYSKAISSALNLPDELSAYREFFRGTADALAIVDELTALLQGRVQEISLLDSLAITEGMLADRQFLKSLYENVAISDELITLLQGKINNVNLLDNLSVVDSLLSDKQFFKRLLENVAITDELLHQSVIFKLLTNSLSISDAMIADMTRQLHIIGLTDALDITDSVATTLVQILVTWGVIKTDLRRAAIDIALAREDIDTDLSRENILTALKKSGH